MLIGGIVFLPFLFGFVSWFAGRKHDFLCDSLEILFCMAELLLSVILLAGLSSGTVLVIPGILAEGFSFAADGFRSVYSVVTSILWAGTAVFSKEYFKKERENLNRYRFFTLVTLGAVQGVMLSADLMTAFVFFEILSFTSFTWVIHEETREAIRAAETYLAVAVIGGLILFMGLLLMKHACNTLLFSKLGDAVKNTADRKEVFAGGVCILLGFGAKAGMFPLHIWLPKAHPAAPAPASALLSGILTKVGIFGILMTTVHAFWGSFSYGVLILIPGIITMALGALLAVFSVNLKRILACSSMSQIGFILTGTGMSVLLRAAGGEEASEAALSGVMLHMLNHSLLKLTLFMAAGAVAMNLHTLDLNEIRGWGRNKTFLKMAFALGGLGISGVPFFNGFISKTLIHESIVSGIQFYPGYAGSFRAVEWIFLISGGATFAYMLKIFITIFMEKNPERQEEFDRGNFCMNRMSTAAVFGSSLFSLILGQPFVMRKIASVMTGRNAMEYFSAWSSENLKGSMISLCIGAAIYFFLIRKVLVRGNQLADLWPANLDLEETVYRPLLLSVFPCIFGAAASVFGENKILKPAAEKILCVCKKAAGFFGENRVLVPVCRFFLTFTAIIGRLLCVSTDCLILLFRRSILQEKKRRGSMPPKAGKLRILWDATGDTLKELSVNFSFSLFMTCLGIVLILGFLLILVLE